MEKLSCAKTVKAQSKKCQNKLMCTTYFKNLRLLIDTSGGRHMFLTNKKPGISGRIYVRVSKSFLYKFGEIIRHFEWCENLQPANDGSD